MSEWLKHVKATMKKNAGKPLKEVLKIAKSTYKKVGGARPAKKSHKARRTARKGRKSRKSRKGRKSRKARRTRRR